VSYLGFQSGGRGAVGVEGGVVWWRGWAPSQKKIILPKNYLKIHGQTRGGGFAPSLPPEYATARISLRPSRRVSLHFDQYQIILLGNGGACVSIVVAR